MNKGYLEYRTGRAKLWLHVAYRYDSAHLLALAPLAPSLLHGQNFSASHTE
jgi:hypothetical protein